MTNSEIKKPCLNCSEPTDNVYLNGVSLCGKCVIALINSRTPEPTKAENGLVPLDEKALSEFIGEDQGWEESAVILAKKICAKFGTPSITKDGDIYNIIDSPSFLTTHILRNWERERIEKFAKHLLGDLHLSITKEQPREIDFDKLFEITASVMKYGGTGHLVAIKVMEAYNTGKLFKPATINDKERLKV